VSKLTAYGNFDVSVDFTNANLQWLTGSPGNQAQLNCFFGDFNSESNFLMVRSDESAWGQNAHVWLGGFGDQGSLLGAAYSTTAGSGTLRVTRTNSLVSPTFATGGRFSLFSSGSATSLRGNGVDFGPFLCLVQTYPLPSAWPTLVVCQVMKITDS
jgi:hypothetical protein